MPRIEIEPDDAKGGYDWGVSVELNRGWLRISQDQDDPNGLQVVLLTPKQARQLVAAYQRRYSKRP